MWRVVDNIIQRHNYAFIFNHSLKQLSDWDVWEWFLTLSKLIELNQLMHKWKSPRCKSSTIRAAMQNESLCISWPILMAEHCESVELWMIHCASVKMRVIQSNTFCITAALNSVLHKPRPTHTMTQHLFIFIFYFHYFQMGLAASGIHFRNGVRMTTLTRIRRRIKPATLNNWWDWGILWILNSEQWAWHLYSGSKVNREMQ